MLYAVYSKIIELIMVLHTSEISEISQQHPLIGKLWELVDKNNNPWIDAILEVTYWYTKIENWKYYNTSLFEEYCWFPYVSEDEYSVFLENNDIPLQNVDVPQLIDYWKLKNKFISKAEWDIEKFSSLFNEITNTNEQDFAAYWIGSNEKKVLIESIEHNICLVKLAINWLDFELEKAWYVHWMNEEEIQEKIQENERLEKIVFWGNILDNQKESEYAYQYMMKTFKNHLDKSQEEQQKRVDDGLAKRVLNCPETDRLSWYMRRIEKKILSKWYSISPSKKNEVQNPTRDFFRKFSHVRIPREKIKNFFQDTISLQWMRQWVKITEKGAIYDWPDNLEIPGSESFESLDFERVCWLAVHEILAHYVNQANHENWTFWKVRLSWNVEKEEWLAMLVEKMFKGLPVTWEDAVNHSFIMVLAAEIFSWDELEDFIDLYMDISERKSSVLKNLQRRKRNYPDNYIGVQHKDVAYVRWLIRVADYLWNTDSNEPAWHIEDLFVWKVWLGSIIAWDFRFDEEKMLFPILSTDIMLFYIMNSLNWKSIRDLGHDKFISYITDKYKWVVSEKSLKKLEETKLWPGLFRSTLRTIQPIVEEFTTQNAANDNCLISPCVEKFSNDIANICNKVA